MSDVLIEACHVGKSFGSLQALSDVSMQVLRREIHCLLGDNGAGKSTLIKILAGVHAPTTGELRFEGERVAFGSPREALDRGIATVYQDLALIPLMSITRNYFLGRELTRGRGPLQRIDWKESRRIVLDEMHRLGVDVRDPEQPVGTLSGGERQSVAIARAVHFGAKLLILDEPTAALGVAQTTMVLKTVRRLRERGISIVLITHNVQHAYAVGDRFSVLDRGRSRGTFAKDEIELHELQNLMAGGKSVDDLSREVD
jgi:simple sugar transport system ATP-binding protein